MKVKLSTNDKFIQWGKIYYKELKRRPKNSLDSKQGSSITWNKETLRQNSMPSELHIS